VEKSRNRLRKTFILVPELDKLPIIL